MTYDPFTPPNPFSTSISDLLKSLGQSPYPQTQDPQIAALQENYARNQAYAQQAQSYQTQLPADQETAFQAWIKQNKVPFESNQKIQDYDMRGFWLALQNKDPRAVSAVDPNDQKIHYPDYWKTPYHATFSNESQWATKDAPTWNDKDQLIDKSGKVLFDDKAPKTQGASK